jgi:hypothetical protein
LVRQDEADVLSQVLLAPAAADAGRVGSIDLQGEQMVLIMQIDQFDAKVLFRYRSWCARELGSGFREFGAD